MCLLLYDTILYQYQYRPSFGPTYNHIFQFYNNMHIRMALSIFIIIIIIITHFFRQHKSVEQVNEIAVAYLKHVRYYLYTER